MPTPTQRTKSGMRPAPGRVLVVDDDERVAESIARVLSAAHSVTVVHSAADALTLITSGQNYDVILCDVMMPVMTGIGLYERVCTIAPEQAKRMVFVTGCAPLTEVHTFLDRVPNAWLEKPFDIGALQAFVERRVSVAREVPSEEPETG